MSAAARVTQQPVPRAEPQVPSAVPQGICVHFLSFEVGNRASCKALKHWKGNGMRKKAFRKVYCVLASGLISCLCVISW